MADPVTLLFGFLLQSAQPAMSGAMRDALHGPRDFRPQSGALPDVAGAVLRCYHPTGRFRAAVVIQQPWQEARQWQVSQSAVIRIQWSGAFTGQPYTTDVALMARGKMARAVDLGSNAMTAPSARCALESWQAADTGQ